MATGNKLVQEISDQFLNCKICGENFKDPKTLTCLHTFCQDCLQELHDNKSTSRTGRYSIYLRHVTCPICDKKTELPSGGVRRLPNNFLVSNLNDVLAKRSTTSNPPCEICHTVKGKTVNASNKCLDCSKLLCSSCVNLHRSTKVTQHHSLIDLQEEKNIQCKVHSEEQVRYYCKPCGDCICVVCAFQDHRDHDVCPFSEVRDLQRSELEALLARGKARLAEVKDRLDTATKEEVAVKLARETIRDMAIEGIARVRAKERALLKQLDQLCGGDSHTLSQGKSRLQNFTSDLESSCCLTEVMLGQQGVELLLVKGDIEAKMNALIEPPLPPPASSINLSELNFVPGDLELGNISLQKPEVRPDGSMSKPDILSGPLIPTKDSCTTMAADMKVDTCHSDSQTDPKLTSPPSTSGTTTDVRQDAQPDLLPDNPRLYTPGRRIWTRRIQTDISAMGVEGLVDLSNEDFIKLMTLSSQKKEISPTASTVSAPSTPSAPVRRRRVRTRERGTSIDQDRLPQNQSAPRVQGEDATKVIQCDQETSTPQVMLETRGVWTDQVSTCDRASDAILTKQHDRAVGTVAVRKENFGQQASPQTYTSQTNTLPPRTVTQITQTDRIRAEQPQHHTKQNGPLKQPFAATRSGVLSHTSDIKSTCDRGSDVIVIPKPSKATETTKVKMSTAMTETPTIRLVDKDVSTTPVKTVDEWTETIQPQMVSTGVAPARPVTQEVGMSTIQVLTSEEATCTEVKSYRDSHTEMVISVCDQETVTETKALHDAQTGMEVTTESESCGTESVTIKEEGSMTDFSQLTDLTDDDFTFYDTQESITSTPCVKCRHETVKVPLPHRTPQVKGQGIRTHTVGTMAMSGVSSKAPLQDIAVQTQYPRVHDKASATSFDRDQEEIPLRSLTTSSLADAATSTESLPYIGLLSEIDVDELIVIPEAHFELVSDSESELDRRDVTMVDEETITEYVQCVEGGTQTRGLDNGEPMTDSTERKAIGQVIKSLVSQSSMEYSETFSQFSEAETEGSMAAADSDKNLVSIGVNTDPRATFEKETCTPMTHLFSKGTMTFYMSKMDKSTSMTSHRGSWDKTKATSVDKETMTSQSGRKDIAVETDGAKMDGRITACISKLRNVSERLASPNNKKDADGDKFFGNNFVGPNPALPTTGPKENTNKKQHASPNAARSKSGKHELVRQKIVKNLLEQSDGAAKPKERKPQPITTLRGRKPAQQKQTSADDKGEKTSGEELKERTQSLPRRFPGERTGVVRMGSQPLPSSRLPLLRYNSAPGRIATVPTQTLINKCGGSESPVPRPVSPSKIPVRRSPPEVRANGHDTHEDTPKLRRPLPSITETRNSTCSDSSNSSFVSAFSATPTKGTTPDMTSSTPTKDPTLVVNNPTPAKTKNLDLEAFAPERCSTPKVPRKKMDTLTVKNKQVTSSNTSLDRSSNPDTSRSSTETLDGAGGKEKKKSFMQRLLSKKKKGSDTKKEKASKKAPPVCVPTVSASKRAETLANAPPPKPAPPPAQHIEKPPIQQPPHHYRPETKPASPPRKPRPFVIVNQRMISIQQDNVEEVVEKRRASLDQGQGGLIPMTSSLLGQGQSTASAPEPKGVQGKPKSPKVAERSGPVEKKQPDAKTKTEVTKGKKAAKESAATGTSKVSAKSPPITKKK